MKLLVTVVGIVLGSLLVSAQPALAERPDGLHHLQVNTAPNVRSIYISTVRRAVPAGYESFTACRPLSGSGGWQDSHQDLVNGQGAKVTVFRSSNCTDGYIGVKSLTTPNADGLDNYWADLTNGLQ